MSLLLDMWFLIFSGLCLFITFSWGKCLLKEVFCNYVLTVQCVHLLIVCALTVQCVHLLCSVCTLLCSAGSCCAVCELCCAVCALSYSVCTLPAVCILSYSLCALLCSTCSCCAVCALAVSVCSQRTPSGLAFTCCLAGNKSFCSLTCHTRRVGRRAFSLRLFLSQYFCGSRGPKSGHHICTASFFTPPPAIFQA